jgi:hypothetical protein
MHVQGRLQRAARAAGAANYVVVGVDAGRVGV